MSVITIDGELVHYEVLGRGRPVILLHGWLGSWRYWVPAMQHLSMKYRAYALDLWGFGDSARIPARYHFAAQVELVARFMSQMGIVKAALVGHDLGAAVAARLAIERADCVPRLMAVGPPLFDLPDRPAAAPPEPAPSVSGFLPQHPSSSSGDGGAELQAALEQTARAIGEARLAAGPARPILTPPDPAPALTGSPSPAHSLLAALPGNGSPAELPRSNPLKDHLISLDRLELLKQHVDPGPDQDKLRGEAAKADPLAFVASLEAFAAVDTLRDLRALTMPAVLVYGEKDTLLPAPAETMLAALTDGRGTFGVMALGGTRHFPMLEDGAAFSRLLMAFLEAPDVTKIAQKDLWVRRVR